MSHKRRREPAKKNNYKMIEPDIKSLNQAEEYWRKCGRKHCYPSKNAAREAARVGNVREGTTNITLFKCKLGRHYHIGHTPNLGNRDKPRKQ